MCGICGQYNFKNPSPVNPGTIRRMTNTIIHRGPDDEGYYFSGPLGFGFRRLSIIDLSGGHQPMSDREQTVWIVFNGEIYNYLELRKELEGNGHSFQTRSDTEVIINGYKQWGENVFNHLNGMFGIGLWDVQKKKLILARDAMGIKLVYYKIDYGGVTFGSEMRPIIEVSDEKPDVDPVALNLFLRYRYTPSPLTIYKGIHKLAPGTMMVFEPGASRLKRWYRFSPRPFTPMPTMDEARDDLISIYKRAVKRHLLSDVPVGLLLSGGVDSGMLLGLMNLFGKDWPTFTIGYGQSFKDDEIKDAAETARILHSRHAPILIDRYTFEKALPRIVNCLEEPIASSSIVPMYFLCERARQDVKVVLNGQGPDELFGGYVRHLGVKYGKYWRSIPMWLQSPLAAVVHALPRNESLKRGVNSLNTQDRIRRYQKVFSIVPEETIDSLFLDGLLPRDAGDAILKCWQDLVPLMENTDELGGLQFIEIRSSLPDELLMYADKLSMAHGLEVRIPYLDREIVEYVEQLDASFKVSYGIRKWLHRKICQDYLTAEIIKRKKRGFGVNVVDDWFSNSLKSSLDSFLTDEKSLMYQFLRPKSVQRLYQDHLSRKNDNHKLLFSLVVFEQWLKSANI